MSGEGLVKFLRTIKNRKYFCVSCFNSFGTKRVDVYEFGEYSKKNRLLILERKFLICANRVNDYSGRRCLSRAEVRRVRNKRVGIKR